MDLTHTRFQSHISNFGKYTVYTFTDILTKNSFRILPQKGARLMQLSFEGKPILDSNDTFEDFQKCAWNKSAILLPFPNRLQGGHYTFEGKQYQFPTNESGRNNLHGFPESLDFEVRQQLITDDSMSIVLGHHYTKNHDYFPFHFDIEITFSLNNKNAFEGHFKITNLGIENMPIGFGWHPYFQLSDSINDIALQLPTCQKIEVDQYQIPTGIKIPFSDFVKLKSLNNTYLDTCFKINPTLEQTDILLESKQHQLHYWQANEPFKYVQIFTPPNRKSIAIEPMTCNINAFRTEEGLKVLAPQEVLEGRFGINFKTKAEE